MIGEHCMFFLLDADPSPACWITPDLGLVFHHLVAFFETFVSFKTYARIMVLPLYTSWSKNLKFTHCSWSITDRPEK